MVLSSVLADNSMHFNENPSGNSILETLHSQRMDGRFCDIDLHVSSGSIEKRFPAHRSVLAACSQYFETRLKTTRVTKEQIHIGCHDVDVFETLLDYMYSGNITIDWNNVHELLKLSNYFLMSKVTAYCSDFLEHYLALDNCIAVRDLAQKYDLEALIDICNEFVTENINEIIEQPFMTEMSAKKLDSIIRDPMIGFTDCPVSQVLTFLISWVKKDIDKRSSELYHFLSFIEWHKMKLEFIYDHIDTEILYRENKMSLYYVLKSLSESDINIERYCDSYNELKKCFLKNKKRSKEELVSDDELIVPDIDEQDMLLPNSPIVVENVEPHSYSKSRSRQTPKDKSTKSHQGMFWVILKILIFNYNYFHSLLVVTELKRKPNKSYKSEVKDLEESESVGSKSRKRSPKGKYNKSEWIVFATNSSKNNRKKIQKTNSELKISKDKPKESSSKEITDDNENDNNSNEDQDEVAEEAQKLGIKDKTETEETEESSMSSPKKDSKSRNRMQSMSLAHWKEGVKCPHCIYVGHSATRLEQHLSRVHQEDTVYTCKMCSYECKWNREYYKHMKSHFEGPPYKCEDCEYNCERIQFILSHRMRHTDERPFECELCSFKSRTKGNLIVHMRIHTGEKPYTCNQCSRSFAMKNTLDQHLATHRDDRPYLCDSCGFTTKYQSHLLSHKRIHTGNVFHCEQEGCTYSSPRRSQLAAHMRSHLSIRSHICSTCGRAFIEKSHLIRHERIHLDEKPFKCQKCDYGSTRRDKLKEHVLKHHTGDQSQKSAYKPRKTRRQTITNESQTNYIIESNDDNSQVAIVSSAQEIQITQSQLSDQELCTATASLIYEYSSDGITVSPARVLIQPTVTGVGYDTLDTSIVDRLVEQRSAINANSSTRVVIQSNPNPSLNTNLNPGSSSNETGGLNAFMALF